MTEKIIYFDNNATTCIAPEVFEVMEPYLKDKYGNPSSMHIKGEEAEEPIKKARCQIAEFLGADPVEITFTSCGTESDNMAIQGILKAYPEKKHIVTTVVEHPAVINQCKELKRLGYEVTFLPVNAKGNIDIEEYKKSIREDTAIVSIMWGNNETGNVYPVEELADIAKEKGTIFHTDGVQIAGKMPINLDKTNIDLFSLSGHKLHAPKGIGILYIKKGTKLRPIIYGGHQERGRRPGTENVAFIAGLGEASRLANLCMNKECSYVKYLRDKLEKELIEKIPSVRINGDPDNRLPNTTNISFEYIEGESILLLMNEKNICASTGSACSSGSLEPSHVLMAMKIPFTSAHGSIRFSLSRYNTEEEVDYVLKAMPGIVEKLRKISPYWKK